MATPLYSTDIIPLTSRPTLTVMDDGDYFVILDTSTGKISKILKTNVMTALKITYDNTSGLTAETVQAALDELVVNLGSIDDAVGSLAEVVDTNRLYSDSQYLALKAKADSLQVKCNTLQAEVYTDDPILQYGAVEIIGDGYEADDTPIDVSANVVDGKLSMEQKGLTITNLVENGDFSGGTTGWETFASVLTVSNKIMSVTGSGTGAGVFILQQSILKASQKTFIKTKVKVTNSVCLEIKVRDSSGVTIAFVENPVENREYELYGIWNLAADRALEITHRYADAATANGKVMEIDGNYGVSAYNLTALGLDHITDTTILSKLLPYVDGTQNVGKMGMRVVGDNLYDLRISPAFIANGNAVLVTEEGRLCWKITNTVINGVIPIPFISGQQYTMSMAGKQTGGNGRLEYVYTDGTSSYTTVFSTIAFGGITNISTSGKTVASIRFYFGDAGTTFIDVDTFMLNLGSTALPYVPYQEQLTFFPAIGNSVPNGTADSIKTVANGWEHTKRVSDVYNLVEADIKSINTTFYTTLDLVFIELPSNVYLTKIIGVDYSSYLSMIGYVPNKGTPSDNIDNSDTYYYGSYFGAGVMRRVILLVAKGTYTTLAEAQSALAGTVIYYQLETPIITHYPLPLPTSGKTIHRFAGEEKIALYGTGLTFSENVLSVLSAVKFVAGVMTDITDLATITDDTVTFSGVNETDVVYVKVEHDVGRPLGILEHTPAVSNTASRLAALEAAVFGG